jgi:two-component system response regulator
MNERAAPIEPVLLLVEDNASDLELTLRALKRSSIGTRVVAVRDGAAAVDYLFAQGTYVDRDPKEVPQVVLLDLNLPKIGGLEVLRRIRADERTKLLPVVILTSSSETKDLADGYGSGANSYVVKPVDFTKFAEAVQQLGVYWLVLNRPAPANRRG